MMVSPTGKMFARTMWPEWDRVRPRELVVSINRKDCYEKLVGGRTVWWGTAEIPESLEGSNLAAWWGDEVRYWKHQSFINMAGRLRLKRARSLQAILTSTPSMGWMEEEFNRSTRGRKLFRIATRENEINLDAGYIENLKLSMSPRMAKSLLDGEFTVIDGQVYECFDDKVHLVDWTFDPDQRTQLWMDFGVRHGSVVFAQETGHYPTFLGAKALPPESLIAFDELQPEDKSTEHVIPMIQRVMKDRGIDRLDAIYCDPAGRARDIASGMTSVHQLRAAFGDIVRFQTGAQETWIPNGIAKVDGLLNPLKGAPTLYLDRKLSTRTGRDGPNDYGRGIYRMLRGLQYPERGKGLQADRYAKDGYLEHVADTVRYGVVNALCARNRDDGRPVRISRFGGR